MSENEPSELEQTVNDWAKKEIEDHKILRELEILKKRNVDIFFEVILDGVTAAVCFIAAPITYLCAAKDDWGVGTTLPRTILYEMNQLYPPELFQLNCAFASAAAIVGATYFYDRVRNPPRLQEWHEVNRRKMELKEKLSDHYQDLWRD